MSLICAMTTAYEEGPRACFAVCSKPSGISIFLTITAIRHSETSIQISGEDLKYPFVLKSSLKQANDGTGVPPNQLPSENDCFLTTQQIVS